MIRLIKSDLSTIVKITIALFFTMLLLPNKSNGQMIFENISVGYSNWTRVYSTPDERVALINPDFEIGKTYQLKLATIQGRIKLSKWIGLNTRVGYGEKTYSSSLKLTQLEIKETLKHTMIPSSLYLDISTPHFRTSDNEEIQLSKLRLKMGLGINRYFVLHKIDREVNYGGGGISKVFFNGNNYGWMALVGLEKNLKPFSVGVDLRYNQGKFYQKLYLEDNPEEKIRQAIDATGFEIGFHVSYYFKTQREIKNQLSRKNLLANEKKNKTKD